MHLCKYLWLENKQYVYVGGSRGLTTGRMRRRYEIVYTQVPTELWSDTQSVTESSQRSQGGETIAYSEHRLRSFPKRSRDVRPWIWNHSVAMKLWVNIAVRLQVCVSLSVSLTLQKFRPSREIKRRVYFYNQVLSSFIPSSWYITIYSLQANT